MFNHQDLDKFDLVIQKEGTLFLAKSPNFPNCCGKGETEKAAVNNLIDDVSLYMMQYTKKALKKAVDSNNFDELVLAPESQKAPVRHKVYNVDAPANFKKKLMMTLKLLDVGALTPNQTASNVDLPYPSFSLPSDVYGSPTIESRERDDKFLIGIVIHLN